MVQESDINFRNLAYNVNDGIFVCDPNGTFIYANLALADIFGFEHPSEIIGKNFIDFFSPEIGQAFMNQFRKSMASGKNSTTTSKEIIRKDGKIGYIEINATPFIKNRVLLGSQGVVHDVTKRRQSESKLMYRSTHDSLTGIYNRTFFEAEIRRLERGRQFPISIVILQVEAENPSQAKDHGGRDKLIKRVAYQLFNCFRGDDIVARIDEEKFAILFPSVDEHTVDEIINRVRGNLQEIKPETEEPALEFYIGASTAKDGERLGSVLKQAEAVVYLEKKKKTSA